METAFADMRRVTTLLLLALDKRDVAAAARLRAQRGAIFRALEARA